MSGEGAARFGGRWNSPGLPLVYLAEHPALAVLEVRVHLDLPFELLPVDFALLRATLPEPAETISDLPDAPQEVGDAWLRAGRSAVLRVPSALVPGGWSLLLNPRHADAAQARIEAVEPFVFDARLWHP